MNSIYTILCVKWGDKYDTDYVLNLKIKYKVKKKN